MRPPFLSRFRRSARKWHNLPITYLQGRDKGWAGGVTALGTVVLCGVGGTTRRLGGGGLCWVGEFRGVVWVENCSRRADLMRCTRNANLVGFGGRGFVLREGIWGGLCYRSNIEGILFEGGASRSNWGGICARRGSLWGRFVQG